MIDLMKYKWLDSQVEIHQDISEYKKEIERFLDVLNTKDYLPGKKNILATYYIEQLTKGSKSEKNVSKLTEKDYKSWYKSASFKKLQDKITGEDRNKFILSAIVSMMMSTLAIFFVVALIRQKFVVSFSIDAIVGCVALIMLGRNLKERYQIIKRYTNTKDFYYLDGAAIILCLLLKIMLPPVFDLTLVVLFVDHFVTKKKMDKIIDEFITTFKA